MDASLKNELIQAQRNEITEYHVYRRLARRQRDPHNRRILERIAEDEKRHYEFWGRHTNQSPPPRQFAVWKYTVLARLFGLTFAIKFMEKGEEKAQAKYDRFARSLPEAGDISRDENEHEHELMNMIDEERLRYVGSIVLGLNDALVELTGALAGFTLALRDSSLIAVIGLITGVAAALSMGASEYLSTKTEAGEGRTPGKAAVYTTIAYIFTVGILVGPYLLLSNPLLALCLTVLGALAIILAFTYYVSIARDLPFGKRFLEMAGLSLGVAAVSFGIGFLLQRFVGVETGG
ncbi:MAG: VIT1/CCC1 transporter family protein [Phycisphaerae bacterium]|nr:VIT1/CCC1 transporter family protein [Phycisphaerae bacterium]